MLLTAKKSAYYRFWNITIAKTERLSVLRTLGETVWLLSCYSTDLFPERCLIADAICSEPRVFMLLLSLLVHFFLTVMFVHL